MSNMRKLGLFYHQMQSMTQAGLSPGDLFSTMEKRASSPQRKSKLRELRSRLDEGTALPAVVREHMGALPGYHERILEIGGRTGNLERTFRMLAEDAEKAQQRRTALLTGLAYPFFLVNMAILITPLPTLVLVGQGPYLADVLPKLAVLWGLALAVLNSQRLLIYFPGLARIVMTVLVSLPLVGPVFRKMEWERYCRVLGLCVDSGLPMYESLEMCVQSVDSVDVNREALAVEQMVQKGKNLAESLWKHASMPEEALHLLETGELTGKLDESLRKVADMLGEQAQRALMQTNKVIGWVVYLGILAALAMRVISFYQGYFAMIGGLGQ